MFSNIAGLAGVDYLSPGALLNYVSYVFGPVIKALKKVGYEEGKDLDAAPYDWRLPFHVLEERDQYCTRTLNQVERMFESNKQRPVVLVCHSMGCLVGHYLLKYAKHHRGQAWVDKYIDCYLPIGGPHLGAPKALRSFISGDKMGLDTFLSDSEALLMGRSLGSGLFLLPTLLPQTAAPVAFVRMEGGLEVRLLGSIDTTGVLGKRQKKDLPEKVAMVVVVDGETLTTPYHELDSEGKVTFDETFHFRLGDDGRMKKPRISVVLIGIECRVLGVNV